MSQVTLRLLGSFQICDGSGRVLKPPRRQCQAILAYLASADGGPIERTELIARFWPEGEPAQSAQRLRQALSTLREALPTLQRPWLLCHRNCVQLNRDSVGTDLQSLRTLVGSDRISDWVVAANYWRGELLQGFDAREEPFNDWLRLERQRLRASVYGLLYEKVDVAIAAGKTSDAIALAEACTRIDPVCESAHRQLMRLYLNAGRKRAAMRQFESFSALLESELGVGPDEETQALFKEIKKEIDEPSRVKPPVNDATAPRMRPRLVITFVRNEKQDISRNGFEHALFLALSNALVRTSLVEISPAGWAAAQQGSVDSLADYQLQIQAEPSRGGAQATFQLVHLSRSSVVWGDNWQAVARDGIKFEEEFVLRLAGLVAWEITYSEAQTFSLRSETELDARQHVYCGLAQMNRLTPNETRKALRVFEKALQLQPDFAWAHACIAWCHRRRAQVAGLTMPRRDQQSALWHAVRAMELDPRDPFVLYQAAEAKAWFDRDLFGAICFAERSLERDASSTRAWTTLAELHCLAGKPEKALEYARQAIDLSPQDPSMWVPYMVRAGASMQLGRYYEAATSAERSLAHNPANRSANLLLAAAYGQMDMKDDARRAFRRATGAKRMSNLAQLPALFGFNRYQNLENYLSGLMAAQL